MRVYLYMFSPKFGRYFFLKSYSSFQCAKKSKYVVNQPDVKFLAIKKYSFDDRPPHQILFEDPGMCKFFGKSGCAYA